MTDEEQQLRAELEAELAKLSPDQRSQIEQQMALQQVMATPVRLPVTFNVESVMAEGEPAIVLTLQTPATINRVVVLRDFALELARQLRKAAETGPQLVVPQSGLIVPGR